MNTLAERLRYAMNTAQPKKAKGVDVARAAGVKPPSVSDWLSGKSKTMEGENLIYVANYLNVNPLWLANGIGEMRPSDKAPIISLVQTERAVYGAKPVLTTNVIVEKLKRLDAEKQVTPDLLNALNNVIDLIGNKS